MRYNNIIKFSSVINSLHFNIRNQKQNNALAFLTHCFHSNGTSNKSIIIEKGKKEIEDFLNGMLFYNDIIDRIGINIDFDIPFPPPKKYKFTFIDLFAGIGGFRIPLQIIGGKCVFSSEIDVNCQEIYLTNFGELPFGDIKFISESDIPSHDILCAGFPCQPFSISGKLKGFEDTRGTLIYDIFRIIKNKKPKVVLLENVKHLKYHNKGETLNVILTHLKELGYFTSWKILNASNFGVPQNRDRIIIIASKLKKFEFSKITFESNVILKDFLDKNSKFEYLNEPYTLIDNPVKQQSGLIFVGYRNKKIRKTGVRPGTTHLSRVHKQPNRIYSINGIHPALPSQETSGRFWVLLNNKKVRKLTLNECYKIMGFTEKFIKSKNLSNAYSQIGNSVCVPMIKNIGIEIYNQLFEFYHCTDK